MSDIKKTTSGVFWITLGTLMNISVKLIILVILSRLLSPEDFGIVASIQIIISFSEIFWMMGVGPALVQKKEITRNDISTSLYLNISFGIILTLFLLFFSNKIADFLNIKDVNMIFLISFIFFFKSISGTSESLLQREMKFNLIARNQIISIIVNSILAISLALLGFKAWSIIIALIVQNVINSCLNIYYRPIKDFTVISVSSCKELLNYGFGFTLSRVFNTFANEGDNLVVNKYLGQYELGSYSRAYQILMVPTLLVGTIIDKVLFPLISKYQTDFKIIRNLYISLLNLILLLTSPLIIFVIINTEIIVNIILGNQWKEVVLPLQILILSLFFRVAYKLCDTITYSLGKVYKRSWTQLVYAISVIAGAYLLKDFGVTGVAISTTIAIILNFLILNQLIFSILDLKYSNLSGLYFNFLVQIIFGVFLYYVSLIVNINNDFINLGIRIAITIFTYIILVYFILYPKFDNFLIMIIRQIYRLIINKRGRYNV